MARASPMVVSHTVEASNAGKWHLGAPRGRRKLLRTRLGGASAGVVAPPGLRKQTLHQRTWYVAAVLPLCTLLLPYYYHAGTAPTLVRLALRLPIGLLGFS